MAPDLLGIGTVISRVVEAIKDALLWIGTQLLRLLRWYWNFLITKPEWGITLTILFIYLLT